MRLLPDMREFNDSAKIQIDVQALIVPSLPKAVQTLEKIRDSPALTQKDLSQQKDSDAAVAVLDEAQEVPTHLAERLLTMVLDPGRCPPCRREQTGAVLGRVCGNPEPFIERLVAGSRRLGSPRLAALAEIAARCKHTLHGHTNAILDECDSILVHILYHELLHRSACRLLGHLGDARRRPLLLQARDEAHVRSCNRFADEADAAIAQISAREEMNAHAMSANDDHTEAMPHQEAEVAIDGAMGARVQTRSVQEDRL